MALLTFYKRPQPKGYSKNYYPIKDSSDTSPLYFDITSFPQTVGGGRYVIKLRGNGDNLRVGRSIDVELLDAEGKNMYVDFLTYTDRFNNYYIMFEVYDSTPKGLATLYLVGEAVRGLKGEPIPINEQETYNVKWVRQFMVLPFERNVGELLFDVPPVVDLVQTIIPERSLLSEENASLSGSNFSLYTSSIDDYTIIASNFKSYDMDFASSEDILDKKLRSLLLNPLQKSVTENSVDSTIRAKDQAILNGYARSSTNRFETIVTSKNNTIRKDFLGGSFSFFLDSTPTSLLPPATNGYKISGSSSDQLNLYTANIVEVLSDKEMRLSKPITLVLIQSASAQIIQSKAAKQAAYKTKYTIKQASNFTGSIAYLQNNPSFVTSSTVSQSFLQATFSDFKPISGEVYRIKTSYKRGIATADYKAIYDQVITPVEYLTDSAFPNQTTYARRESDARLIGHFTDQTIANDYWDYYVENVSNTYIGTVLGRNSSSLSDSIPVLTDFSESGVFTTKFYQNYSITQLYTLTFNVTLDPNIELEIYMNSDELNANTFTSQAYPRAFLKTPNLEKTRYRDAYNRFGQFVGKITNKSSSQRRFGKVEFDFETDGEGFGRPLFRTSPIGRANLSGSAYLSEISIKPIKLNGFTPSIVQFNIPFNSEIESIITLSQSLDFKLEYFDYTGKQSEFTTYINDLIVNLKGEIPSNTCQAQKQQFWINTNRESY